MGKKSIKIFNTQNGFTLLEVLMAFTLFGLFITAFILSQGSNVTRSSLMNEDLTLHALCEMKLNEAILDPPKFTNATKNDVKTGTFDGEEFTQYKYKIEYLEIKLPDLKHLLGGEEEDRSSSEQQTKKMIFEKLKKNLEKVLWQLRVTVTNTQNDYSYVLSTWITNEKAEMDTNFAM